MIVLTFSNGTNLFWSLFFGAILTGFSWASMMYAWYRDRSIRSNYSEIIDLDDENINVNVSGTYQTFGNNELGTKKRDSKELKKAAATAATEQDLDEISGSYGCTETRSKKSKGSQGSDGLQPGETKQLLRSPHMSVGFDITTTSTHASGGSVPSRHSSRGSIECSGTETCDAEVADAKGNVLSPRPAMEMIANIRGAARTVAVASKHKMQDTLDTSIGDEVRIGGSCSTQDYSNVAGTTITGALKVNNLGLNVSAISS